MLRAYKKKTMAAACKTVGVDCNTIAMNALIAELAIAAPMLQCFKSTVSIIYITSSEPKEQWNPAGAPVCGNLHANRELGTVHW